MVYYVVYIVLHCMFVYLIDHTPHPAYPYTPTHITYTEMHKMKLIIKYYQSNQHSHPTFEQHKINSLLKIPS